MAETVRSWVIRQELPAGAPLPSASALGRQFGVTAPTMFRACQALVSAGFLHRNGYKLMVGVGGPSSLHLEKPIIVVSYWSDFLRAAGRYLTERRIAFQLVELSWRRHLAVEPILHGLLRKKPAGLVVGCPSVQPSMIARLESSGIPVVLCVDVPGTSSLPSISNDFFRGTEIALRHLLDVGHRHIAHLVLGSEIFGEELERAYRLGCLQLDLRESAARRWPVVDTELATVQGVIRQGLENHPEVTAIFADDRVCLAATKCFSVPRDFSLVGFFGLAESATCEPPLTTIGTLDDEFAPVWGCTQVITQIQTMASGRPPRSAVRCYSVPGLILRESTREMTGRKARHVVKSTEPARPHPRETWQNAYPSLLENKSEDWLQVDLGRLANHSMKRQNGWLGSEPLLHFPPGLRSIHGVPFQVLDEDRNGGHSVLTFRSPHSHSAGRKGLPTSRKIKVDSTAKAIYFLHGCGFAIPVPFAKYIFHFARGKEISVDLVPHGRPGRLNQKQAAAFHPNMQDWWPDGFPREDYLQAHHLTVFDPADPAVYQRTLYSLEWINPRPTDPVTSIEVKVDPQAGPTLALIAVTVLV